MNANKELSLWQLTNEHQKLLSELYNFETGEINDIVQAKLDALEPNVEKKCISVSKYIQRMESEERELSYLLKEIENRKNAYEKEIEKYKNYLEYNMRTQGIKEIKCPLFTIRIKKNPYSTEITNKDEVPKEFVKKVIKTEEVISKTLIKEEVLKTGIQVPGAYVAQKEKLEILISKI